jgi:hypothetical protein
MSSREKPSESAVWCGKSIPVDEKVDARIFLEMFQILGTAA